MKIRKSKFKKLMVRISFKYISAVYFKKWNPNSLNLISMDPRIYILLSQVLVIEAKEFKS